MFVISFDYFLSKRHLIAFKAKAGHLCVISYAHMTLTLT